MISSLLSSLQTLNLTRDDASERAPSPASTSQKTETSSTYSLRARMEDLDLNDDISLPGSFESFISPVASRQPRRAVPPQASYPLHESDLALETFLTAATLTSTENMPSHHHKLFSSSAEFHRTASEGLPEKLHDLTIHDVVQSVERVVKDTYQKAFRPSDRFGRLSVHGFEQAKAPSPSMSHDATPKPPKYELDEVRQMELLSQQIEEHHRRVLDKNLGRQTQVEQCRVLDEALAFAKKGWTLVGESVERQKEREQKAAKRERIKGVSSPQGSSPPIGKLQEGRERVRERIRSLQAKVAVLYASKPTPVDADYLYDPPIEQRHEIHQVMIILAVVCNMVIGLSTTQCDFIIGMALILVKMAMSAGRPLDTVGELEQDKVKSAMPKSLREALRDFDIDGRFQLFAACPRCHYTNPSLSFDSDFPEFPETCSNEIVSDVETRRCDEPLLQCRRDNSTQPIKPYLVGSFKDYLARCVADPTYLSQSLTTLCEAHKAH
ncbi:hypothetical protein PM082_019713 [Marasmius tenuissimus]|nr:hypothetical protein PM082_019713 [Marasmius tenuissimus]